MKGLHLLVLLTFASPVAAQGSSWQRTLELPAHRALQSVMSAPEAALEPFASDGCSGGMSWSWRLVSDLFPGFEAAQGDRPPWEDCCVVHDRAYHDAGGARSAEESFAARLAADTELRSCVIDQGESNITRLAAQYDVPEDRVRQAYAMIGDAMYNAVRLGGGPCTALPWRWGFGYAQCLPEF